MNKYNRTNKVLNSNYTDPSTKAVYMGFQIPADNFNAQSNFYNCYKNRLSALNTTGINLDKYSSVINVLKQIESSFKCNGICDYGNFYFFVDVSQGPPSKTCTDNLATIFDKISLNLGIVMGITFIFVFLSVCQQYWFCFRKRGSNAVEDLRSKSRNVHESSAADSFDMTPNKTSHSVH